MAGTRKDLLVWHGRPSELDDALGDWVASCPGHSPQYMSRPYNEPEADFMMRQIHPEARVLFVGTRTMRMEWLLGAAERYGVDHIDLTI